MYPQVLSRIDANEFFDRLGIPLRNVPKRVGFVLPVGRVDDVLYAQVEVEAVVDTPCVADDDGHFVLHRQQADDLVRAGLAVEEVDEHAFVAGVLVGDDADDAFLFQNLVYNRAGTFFVDDLLALAFAHAHEEFVDVRIVERPCDADGFEAQRRQCVAENFPVAVMPGQHDYAVLAVEDHLQDRADSVEAYAVRDGFEADQSRREQHFEKEHHQLLLASSRHSANVFVAHVGETSAQIPNRPLAMPAVEEVHEVAQQLRGLQYAADWIAVQRHVDEAHRVVLNAVEKFGSVCHACRGKIIDGERVLASG